MTNEEYVQQIKQELGPAWLPAIYRDRILKMRTRSYDFEISKKNPSVEIHHTLLGIELKIGKRRLMCPDLATARYLAVFARVGCATVALPYDITRISQLADELESAWYRMLLLADHKATGKSPAAKTRIRGLLIATVRSEIGESGAGERMPEFRHTTKQRR